MPKHNCTFCGGLLTATACRGMRAALNDPTQRKKLVQGLKGAFRTGSVKEIVRKSTAVVDRVRRQR